MSKSFQLIELSLRQVCRPLHSKSNQDATHSLSVFRRNMSHATDSRSLQSHRGSFRQTPNHSDNRTALAVHRRIPSIDRNMLNRPQHEISLCTDPPALSSPASGHDRDLWKGRMSEIINWNLDTELMAIMIKVNEAPQCIKREWASVALPRIWVLGMNFSQCSAVWN